MSFQCDYCKKFLSSRGSLKKHRETTKSCINLRVESSARFLCMFCKKSYSTNQALLSHNLTSHQIQIVASIKKSSKVPEYKNKIKFMRKELEKQELIIADLQDRIERLCTKAIEKPTNTIKNKFNLSVFPSQTEIIRKIESKFTDEYMLDGISGVAKFVYDHIVKLDDGSMAYACFDRSRKIFKFRDSTGKEIKDPNATKLISVLKHNLIEQNRRVLNFFDLEVDNMLYIKNRDGVIDEDKLETLRYKRDKVSEVGTDMIFIDEKKSLFCGELADLIC
jgi:hypothetical protein